MKSTEFQLSIAIPKMFIAILPKRLLESVSADVRDWLIYSGVDVFNIDAAAMYMITEVTYVLLEDIGWNNWDYLNNNNILEDAIFYSPLL